MSLARGVVRRERGRVAEQEIGPEEECKWLSYGCHIIRMCFARKIVIISHNELFFIKYINILPAIINSLEFASALWRLHFISR